MEEKTNQEIYDKMLEAFRLILKDINIVKTDTYNIKDVANPTHQNVRDIYGLVYSLHEKIDLIGYRVNRIEKNIENLKN